MARALARYFLMCCSLLEETVTIQPTRAIDFDFPRLAGCRGKWKNGIKQQSRARFSAQAREPEGQSDAGWPSLLLSWPRKKEETTTPTPNY